MTATSILAGLNEEATQLEVLGNVTVLLAEILANMPRIDTARRLVIGNETTQTVSLSTLATVTTVGTVSNQTNIGGRDAGNVVYAMANMGTAHIYNNIVVS